MRPNYSKLKKETGGNLYEYLVLMLFVVVLAVPSVQYFGDKTEDKFQGSVDVWDQWVTPAGNGPG